MQKLILVIGTLLVYQSGIAQETRGTIAPVKGFQPAYSYSLDQVESINLSNGALGLRIPLAELPPGAGGLTANVSLIYNSKLFSATPQDTSAEPIYDLRAEFQGGWMLNTGYTLMSDGPAYDDLCGGAATRL
jgi:hypothetical protein